MLWVVLPYAIVGALWIAFSDALLEATTPVEWRDELQTMKGLLFVLVTSASLATLLGRREAGLQRAQAGLETARASNRLLAERLRALARRVLDAQEQERARLARDLHDELGQRLTVAKLALDPADDGPHDAAVARRVVGEALETVRRLSVDLRPPMLENVGLLGALRWMLERTDARFDLHGPHQVPLSTDAQLALYRVVQEATTNALRHAAATRIEVRLDVDAEAVEVTVADDGRGFDPASASPGVGILGMRERLEAISGVLDVQSAPGRGARLVARVPRLA